MDGTARIERAIEAALERSAGRGSPPQLATAMRYAVFPGGARVRPRLCLAVAEACGDSEPKSSESMASAIEFLHCASLVHDDLPCFDNADSRRGKPSVHMAFGEPLAVLAGDALIVLAFETLAHGLPQAPGRLASLLMTLARASGMPSGIVAGQAWECEPNVSLSEYHRQKTGALFVAATVGGAIAGGGAPEQWRRLGECIGEAYQVADDIKDLVADRAVLGKPLGQDAANGRPSAVGQLGLRGALTRLEGLLSEAMEAIPPCEGQTELRGIIRAQATRLVPKELATAAA
ncbi:MAG: polyprenyl synthetase family protein [Hyphomicrobiaceae bacterium]|nr:polyprenyl synthetase family protein [Hyphomicrobiaceae bacterium]